MQYDESYTYALFARKGYFWAMSIYPLPNNHILHSLLVRFSTQLLGNAPWAIRMPAFVAGVALLPAAFVMVNVLYGRDAAMIAASLVTVSEPLVSYSANGRGYTLVAVCFCVAVTCAARLLRRRESPADWVVLVFAIAAGFFAVPIMLYGCASVWLWLLIARRRSDDGRLSPALRTLVLWGLAAAALTLLLYTPALLASGWRNLAGNQFVKPLTVGHFASRFPASMLGTCRDWNTGVPAIVAIVLLLAFAAGALRRTQDGRPSPWLAIVPACGVIVAMQRVVPFERVWMFLLPLYFGTAAAGLVAVMRLAAARISSLRVFAVTSIVASVLLLVLGIPVVASRPDVPSIPADAPAAVAFLRTCVGAGDRVLCLTATYPPVLYHAIRAGTDFEPVDMNAAEIERFAHEPTGTLFVVAPNARADAFDPPSVEDAYARWSDLLHPAFGPRRTIFTSPTLHIDELDRSRQ
jgi:uncharacterized membrane protein